MHDESSSSSLHESMCAEGSSRNEPDLPGTLCNVQCPRSGDSVTQRGSDDCYDQLDNVTEYCKKFKRSRIESWSPERCPWSSSFADRLPKDHDKPCYLAAMPTEILLKICSLLCERDLCNLAGVSRRFNTIADDLKNWQSLYQSVFEYKTPLYYKAPNGFAFTPANEWKELYGFQNAWKKSFEMISHGVHVWPGRCHWTEKSRSRRLIIFADIEDALNYVKEKATALVFLHPGIYFNVKLVIDKSVCMIGSSPDASVSSVTLVNGTTVFDFSAGADFAYVGYMTIKIEGDPESMTPFCSVIRVQRGCSPTFEKCEIQSNNPSGAAVTVTGRNANPFFQKCKIANCASAGLCITDYAQGHYLDTEIAGNKLAGIWIKNFASPKFKNCEIHGGNDVGVFVFEHGLGNFEQCDIHSNRISGVEIKEGGNPLIRKCAIHDGATGGVYVHEGGRGHIVFCRIFANNFAGIWITMHSNPTIRNNKIYGGRQGGVYIFNQGRGVIEGNEIYDNALAGIQIRTDSDPIVRNNRIHHGQHGGIYVHESGRGIIENNEVYMNRLAGIWVTTGSWPVIRYNRIHSGRQVGVYYYDDGNGLLEENEIYDHQYSGVQIRSGSNPHVLRNKIWGGENGGVLIYNDGRGCLEENEIYNNAMAGVWIKTHSQPTLCRNKIFDSRHMGVCIFSDGGGTLISNEIFRNAQAGVLISSSGNPTLQYNAIHDNTGTGIELTSNSRGVIVSNIIYGNLYAGIAVATSAKPLLKDNKIFSNQNAIEEAAKDGKCLFQISGSHTSPLHEFYSCDTCCASGQKTICVNCAKHCHDGHDVRFVRCDRFFCDCGAGSLTTPCTLYKRNSQMETSLQYRPASPTQTMTSTSNA